jgi:hypothetical protein
MDAYDTGAPAWLEFDSINISPWAGLQFFPDAIASEAWYTSPLFRGMCFLDDIAIKIDAPSLAGKKLAYLPDITEYMMPAAPSDLLKKIQKRAAGRRMIFMGGSIGSQKNLARWLELIEMAGSCPWYFVQIGKINRVTLGAEDKAALDRAVIMRPENLFIMDQYIPDERIFNEIIAAASVIFAVYQNFPGSSNMLSKAAHFHRPILVSNGYLMGKRVKQYGIGLAVDETRSTEMLDGLRHLMENQIPAENFARYSQEYSQDILKDRFNKFLMDCL